MITFNRKYRLKKLKCQDQTRDILVSCDCEKIKEERSSGKLRFDNDDERTKFKWR